LGVHAKNISDQLKEYFEVEGGVLIEKVIEDSPAEKAGLKAGDIILKIEDKDIEDYGDLVRVLNYYDPGDELSIVYSRKGSKKTIKVVVDKKEGAFPNLRWIQEGSLPEIMEEMPILEEELEQLKDLERELDDIKVDIKVLYI
jgi:C-terminal processing protease CtpA/Prc